MRGIQRERGGAGAQHPPRLVVWGVLAVSLLVYVWATPRVLTYTEPPTGDQPFYLQTAISLIEDHDINEYNNYGLPRASYNEFYPPVTNLTYPAGFQGILAPYPLSPRSHVGATTHRPAEEWYSKHGLGVPVLILPGWLLGKALTPWIGGWTVNGSGGWPGTVFEFNLLGALLAVQVFLLAWDTTRRLGIALAVWAALAFSNPQMSYSLLLFPELPAALLAVYAFRRLMLGWASNARWQLLLVGLCLGYIPWLHARFLPITLGLALFALVQWWRARAGRKPLMAMAEADPAAPSLPVTAPPIPPAARRLSPSALLLVMVPLVLSGVWLMSYYYWLYGSPLPNTQDHAGFFVPWLADNGQLVLGDVQGLGVALLGLFLDQQWGLLIYAPVYVLAAVGAVTLWHDPAKRAWLGWLALVIVPYFLVVADYRVWWGEWCPPARYLAPVTPLLALPLAQSLLALRRSTGYGALFAGLGGLGVALMGGLIAGLGDHAAGQLPTFFNHPSGQASLFLWLNYRFHLNLVPFLPGMVPHFMDAKNAVPWALIAAWFAVFGALLVGALMLLDDTRQRAAARLALQNSSEPV